MKIKKISQSAGVIADVVNSLDSNSSTDALSANQGKVLKEEVNSKVSKNGDTMTGSLLFEQGKYITQEGADTFEENNFGAFTAIEKWRTIQDGTKKKVSFGHGSLGAAVLEAQDDQGNVNGRLEVRQDGTIYNYVTKNNLTEEEEIEIPASEFFGTLNYNLMDWKCYRRGNMINLQRCVIEGVNFTGAEEIDIGTVKTEYSPYGNCTIRIMASIGGGANINGILMITAPSNRVAMYYNQDLIGNSVNTYIFNTTYLAKGGF